MLCGLAAAQARPAVPEWSPKLNSPGLSLQLEEMGRGPIQGHTVVRYRLRLRGAAFGARFRLAVWSSVQTQPRVVLNGVTLDPGGLAICAGRPGTCGSPKHPDAPATLALEAAQGELERVGLISPDGKSRAFALVTPFPALGNDRNCRVELLRYGPEAQAVSVYAAGFAPKAALLIQMDSAGESHRQSAAADAHGEYHAVIAPQVRGVPSGVFRILINGPACAPAASIHWGAGSYVLQEQ